jgi:C_GCAxxG_C_C family probable redox protein
MENPAELAEKRFSESFNCAQAVFSAFAARYGLDGNTALKIASPFGGGMARRGEVCGAVTGALLALGLKEGAELPAGKDHIYQLAGEFLRLFQERHGSLLCRDLIGCDISTPSGHQQAAEKRVFVTICPGLVREAAQMAESLLETD